MDHINSSKVDYSHLSNNEIENIKKVEEDLNQNREEPVILLAVNHQ